MCWNWFDPGHQQEGTGEPGMITALTRSVLDTDFNGRRADPSRVYIAGLSAGGAMAAVVAGLHPELFTALGVHSGLPAGAASNVMSAFQAMRTGGQGKGKDKGALAMPTIVFHGDGDTTVHPSNGENIAADALAALRKADTPLTKTQSSTYPEGERAERNDKPTDKLTELTTLMANRSLNTGASTTAPTPGPAAAKKAATPTPTAHQPAKRCWRFFCSTRSRGFREFGLF
jgi:poly(3-hydroxybutyrate) depolymerase